MEYSALIFDDCMDETDSYENLENATRIFQKEEDCKQIVVSCTTEWLLELSKHPLAKMLLVQMSSTPYVALLNGLKAITQENVVVVGLSRCLKKEDVTSILKELRTAYL